MLLKFKKQVDEFNQCVADYNKMVKKNANLKVEIPNEMRQLLDNSIYKDFNVRTPIDPDHMIVSVEDVHSDQFQKTCLEQISGMIKNWNESALPSIAQLRGMNHLTHYQRLISNVCKLNSCLLLLKE